MNAIRFTLLGDISDPDLLALVDELERAAGVSAAEFVKLPLTLFLTQCVYPTGEPDKRTPISSAMIPVAPWLDAKVGKLPDGAVRALCAELAVAAGQSLELFHRSKIAAFLNQMIPKIQPPANGSARQAREERIVMQRRANRG